MKIDPQIRILPEALSEFAIHVYGTENEYGELREILIKVLAALEETRTRGPKFRQDVAHYVAQALLSMDMLYGAEFWTEVADHAAEQTNQLAACMGCHGFSEPGDDYA